MKYVRFLLLFVYGAMLSNQYFAQDANIIDSLKQVIKNAKHDTSRISAYLSWGETVYLANPDSALIQWQQALTIADASLAGSNKNSNAVHDTLIKQKAAAINNMGYVFKSQGDLSKALECYQKSLKNYEQIGDKKGVSLSLNNIGTIYYNQGDITKAVEYFNNSLKIQAEIGDKIGAALSLNNIGAIYNNLGDIPKAVEYYRKSQKIYEDIGDKIGMANAYNNIGYIYYNHGDAFNALDYFQKSLAINKEIGDKKGIALCLNNIGTLYSNQGDISRALENIQESLKNYEELGNKKGVANSFNNIGLIYNNQGDVPKALEYYQKSLKYYEEIGEKQGVAYALNNIGTIYKEQGNDQLALEYFQKSFKNYEETGEKKGIANSLNNIGDIYKAKGDVPKALEYYNNSLKNFEEIGDKNGITNNLVSLGTVYLDQNDIAKAKINAAKAHEIALQIGFPDNIKRSAGLLKKIYQTTGNYKQAYEYFELEVKMRDTIANEENFKKTQKQQARYEYGKKAAVDSIAHTKAIEIKNLELARSEEVKGKQRMIIYSFVAGFIIILVFSILLFRLFVQKQKANKLLALQNAEILQKNEEITAQKEEIENQRDEITAQRDTVTMQKEHIEEIHREVTDSINYAKRIQEAVLPDIERNFVPLVQEKIIGDYFILFKPRDIVSGDFYWTTKVNQWLIIAVADCTGHGVPGAFMSMLGISFLNEIVRKQEVTQANHVLNHLREEIINALRQKGASEEQKDGMDIALCAINTGRDAINRVSTCNLQFAGANNPLYTVETRHASSPPHSLNEIRPDKMPVAIYEKMQDFTNHEINLQAGDTLYLTTDGFEDQFGGPKGKKFLSKRLKELLVETCPGMSLPVKTMTEQKEILAKTIEDWKNAHNIRYEQTDDITVMGIRI